METAKEEESAGGSVQKIEEQKKVEHKESLPSVYLYSSEDSRTPSRCTSLKSVFPAPSWTTQYDSDDYPRSEHTMNREEVSTSLESITSKETIEEEKLSSLESIISDSYHNYYPEPACSPSFSLHEIKSPYDYLDLFSEGFSSLHSILNLPISPKVCSLLNFSENLIISSNDGEKFKVQDEVESSILVADSLLSSFSKPVGCFHLNVKTTNEKFITYCDTHFISNELNAGSRIISTVDQCFNLVEELKTETECMPGDLKEERSLHIFREHNHFIAYQSHKSRNQNSQKRGTININIPGSFLLDGALFTLMRFLVITKFKGAFKLWSMDIDGRRCKCFFDTAIEESILINESYVRTIKIKKTLYKQGYPPEISETNFLPNGFMVRHKWEGCPLFIHLDPATTLPPTDPSVDIKWQNNLILVSKYLDRKDRLISEMESYLMNNSNIKDLLKDYMMALLQLKPQNVLSFTIDFFLNLNK